MTEVASGFDALAIGAESFIIYNEKLHRFFFGNAWARTLAFRSCRAGIELKFCFSLAETGCL